MVLAHLMQALSASRPRSSIGTQGILISYCVMRILMKSLCSGQQKLATALEFFQNNLSDSFGVKPPLY